MSLPRNLLLQCALATSLCCLSLTTQALNILISNDDGLTSNVKALYQALKGAGHDVAVSLPCTGQSGRGGGIVMYSTAMIVADNDTQVTTHGGCLNGAAMTGEPAVGRMTKPGFDNGDFHYVHGTPVMATLYGLDVVAQARWGQAPDLMLSGPNEGQNVGTLVTASGTIGNVQAAAARGIPSIALSAGHTSKDNPALANPISPVVAQLTLQLIDTLASRASEGPFLPPGLALNVNFPEKLTPSTPFRFSRQGTYDLYRIGFKNSVPYGLGGSLSDAAPTDAQAEDEAVVFQGAIAVTAMQVGYEQSPYAQQYLQLQLRGLLQRGDNQ